MSAMRLADCTKTLTLDRVSTVLEDAISGTIQETIDNLDEVLEDASLTRGETRAVAEALRTLGEDLIGECESALVSEVDVPAWAA